MIYPDNISGPQLDKGDLLEFTFEGGVLVFRLPVIPDNTNKVDQVSSITDFSNIDTEEWEVDSEGAHAHNLATQKWTLEDTESLDDIATCWVDISIVEMPEELQASHTAINKKNFKKYFLTALTNALGDEEIENLDDQNHPGKHNDYNCNNIQHENLDGIQVQLSFAAGNLPSPLAYIAIDNRFVLSVSLHMNSLHYSGRENIYSDELIQKIEHTLFDEFIKNINLEKTPELIALIKSVN